MASNIQNQLRALQKDHKILIALKQTGQLRFTEIHKQTKRSSEQMLTKMLTLMLTMSP